MGRDRRSGYDRRARGQDRRRSDAADAAGLFAVGFLGGLAAGLTLWSGQLTRSRQGLFSPNPVRRLAALGYLRGRPSVDTARLLRDYIEWEARPTLRRRARQVLQGVENSLDR